MVKKLNEEIIYQYGIIANTGFKIETIDGDDLTEDLRVINPPIFNGRQGE